MWRHGGIWHWENCSDKRNLWDPDQAEAEEGGGGGIVAPLPEVCKGREKVCAELIEISIMMAPGAIVPGLPPGVTNQIFGDIVGWAKGGTLRGNLRSVPDVIKNLPDAVERLVALGVSSDGVNKALGFYREAAFLWKENPNALSRVRVLEALEVLLKRMGR